jgi:hypothetical protein
LPVLTPLAACAIGLETLGLSGLYARHSRKLTAANPLVWSVAMALMAAFVAWPVVSQSVISAGHS